MKTSCLHHFLCLIAFSYFLSRFSSFYYSFISVKCKSYHEVKTLHCVAEVVCQVHCTIQDLAYANFHRFELFQKKYKGPWMLIFYEDTLHLENWVYKRIKGGRVCLEFCKVFLFRVFFFLLVYSQAKWFMETNIRDWVNILYLFLVCLFLDGTHRSVVRLIWPRGLWHDAGLCGGQEVPWRGHDPQLQSQVSAQGQQERAALVSNRYTNSSTGSLFCMTF